MSLIAHHLGMLEFERWANAKVIASLRSVPESRRGDAAFAKARGILAHNQMARRMWLSRLGAVEEPTWVMFPDWSIEQIEQEAAALDAAWAAFLKGLDDAGLARPVRYSSTEGKAWESSVAEILTHVHNHSTYHRGQVAMLVTSVGGERAGTDHIGMTRRPGN